MDKIQNIVANGLNGQYSSQEEFNAAIKQAQMDFNADMAELNEEYNSLVKNVSESSMEGVLDAYRTNSNGLEIFSKDAEALMTELSQKIGTDWTLVSDLVESLNSKNSSDFSNFCKQMGIDWSNTNNTLKDGFSEAADNYDRDFASAVEEISKELNMNLTHVYANVASSWDKAVIDQITNNNNLEHNTDKAVNKIIDKWTEVYGE